MKCANCGRKLDGKPSFCMYCGTPTDFDKASGQHVCQRCGLRNVPGHAFCTSCGNPLYSRINNNKHNSDEKTKGNAKIVQKNTSLLNRGLVVGLIFVLAALVSAVFFAAKIMWEGGELGEQQTDDLQSRLEGTQDSGGMEHPHSDFTVLSIDDMNNYMQNYSEIVYDDKYVYFTNSEAFYKFNKSSGKLESVQAIEEEGALQTDGLVLNGFLFSHLGFISPMENLFTRWTICEKDKTGSYMVSESFGDLLPYSGFIYYISMGTNVDETSLVRTPISIIPPDDGADSLKATENLICEKCETVFRGDSPKSFGIYNNTLIIITKSADIWSVDLDTMEEILLVSGEEISVSDWISPSISMDGDYLYFVNYTNSVIERIHLDGSGREYFLQGMNVTDNNSFICADGYLFHVNRGEDGNEYCLFRTSLSDPEDTIVIASGLEEGIDCWIKLAVIDGWIYYGGDSLGLWRVKVDGSSLELLTYGKSATDYYFDVSMTANCHNIAAGYEHTVAIKDDGTVAAIGRNQKGECEVQEWRDVASVSADEDYTVALKTDGTLYYTGAMQSELSLSELYGAVSIRTGGGIIVGLHPDGTVAAIGPVSGGAKDVDGWTDIVAIDTSGQHTVGVKKDGTCVAVGNNDYGQCEVSSWTDIVDVSLCDGYTVGLKSDGTLATTERDENGDLVEYIWTDIIQIAAGKDHAVGLSADGKVFTNPENNMYIWTDIVEIDCMSSHIVGIKSDGTAVAKGDNIYGECDLSDWTNIRIKEDNELDNAGILPVESDNNTDEVLEAATSGIESEPGETRIFENSFIIPDSASRYLTREDVIGLSLQEINYARNEIYARHGRKFNSKELAEYFNSKTWYVAKIDPETFDRFYASELNEYEVANAYLLQEIEFEILPGGYVLDQ